MLRALNGAALGTVAGAPTGAALGACFAAALFGVGSASLGALLGVFPGLAGGFLIGTTVVVRDPRRGMLAAAAMGLGVGVLYAGLVGGGIAVPVIASGLIGGAAIGALLRWIRARWVWWRRWEG